MNAPTNLDLLSFSELLSLMDEVADKVKRHAASADSEEFVAVKVAVQVTRLSEDTILRRLNANPSLGQKIGGRRFDLKALIVAEAE